ncbi:hypothetical protein [Nocardia sp. NPDC058480]|uniref:hypothetical protein n=1 Tax=unclassified Nocardia TaxID=2637762 RepID=UPI00364AFC96
MAGTENPKIPPRTERPQELSHAKIIDSFDPVGVDPSFGAVAVFWQAKTDWEVGLATFRQRMHAAIAEAWEGNAAEASKNAISSYTTKAEELTPTFETVARLISSSALSSSDTKSSLPARKEDPDIWDINDRWINNDEFEDGRNDDEEDARAIMKAKYVEAFGVVDAGLPVLDHPTSLVTDSFVPGGDGDDGNGDGGGDDGGGSDDEDEDNGTGDDPDTGDENTGDDDNTGDDTEDDTTGDDTAEDDTEDDTTSDDDTAAASTESPATTPGTTTPNAPGSSGSPSSPSGGSPSAGVPGAAVPTPGRAIPGIPAAAVTGTAAAASAAGGAGRGTTGAPGMMGAGAGRGGGKDDENTHETPDYLINEENTRELIGEIAKATPQAIGARFLSAQTLPADQEGESK